MLLLLCQLNFLSLFHSNCLDMHILRCLSLLLTLHLYIFAMLCKTPGNKVEIGTRNMFYVACLCQAFSGVYSIAGRLGFYYTIYVIIFIPSIIKNVSFFVKSERFVAKYVCYLLLFGFFITYGIYQLSSRTSWAMPNPHHFYWTKDYLINLIKVLTI